MTVLGNLAFCLTLILVGTGVVAGLIDVALMEFILSGSGLTVSLGRGGGCLDMGVERLTMLYGDTFNFTRVRFLDDNVTACEMQDQRATFWSTRYYYKDNPTNPVMMFVGPGCPVGAASVGHLARAWNKPMMIPVAGDTAVADKRRYPTLTRIGPYIPEDLNKFVVRLLKQFNWTTVGFLCSDAMDKLQIYLQVCNSMYDDLKIKYNITANRYYVNISNLYSPGSNLDDIKSFTRGNFNYSVKTA